MDWLEQATRFSFKCYKHTDDRIVCADVFHIEKEYNSWVVIFGSLILDSGRGRFVYNLRSNYTRFSSKEEAYTALQKYLEGAGYATFN